MSSLEVIFLGTGSAYPSPHRGASCAVLRSDAGLWMFDCGEGSQIQLMRSSLRPSRLNKIFITHLHGDHMFGLPGLLCTISQNSAEDRAPVELYGPVGLRKFVRTSLHLSRSILGFQIAIHELCHDKRPEDVDGIVGWSPSYVADDEPHPQELTGHQIWPTKDGVWEVCHEGPFSVHAATLKHRVICFGYVITEAPLPGKLLVDKLKVLGVPPGPLYAQLKRGESIVTADGKEVSPVEVLGPPRPGRKLVMLGDTADSSDIAALAANADVIIHEATNECAHEEKARANGHSTPGMAAAFCRQVGGKRLILTHFSQRYRGEGHELGEGEESVKKLVLEAEEALNGTGVTVEAADDFKTFKIPAKKA